MNSAFIELNQGYSNLSKIKLMVKFVEPISSPNLRIHQSHLEGFFFGFREYFPTKIRMKTLRQN